MANKKVNRSRLAGFVVAIIISIPLGLLLCSEVFKLPIWAGLVILLACHLTIGPVFYRKVVKEESRG